MNDTAEVKLFTFYGKQFFFVNPNRSFESRTEYL